MVDLKNDWTDILRDEFEKEYYLKLREFLRDEYKTHRIFPEMQDIFSALRLTPYDSVKVVILGQDPYHGEGQAHGLAFSVKDGVAIPPSLRNMYKEIYDETGNPPPESGNLTRWAEQGVLLLNAALTVREGEANSHRGRGWEQFTDAVIKYISDNCEGVVFMLWGNFARTKSVLIDRLRHHVLEAAHPSPLARGAFFGCRHFSKANAALSASGRTPIDWQL